MIMELEKYIDEKYDDDYEFKDGEYRKASLEFFKENASKELYEFLKNFKLIENTPDLITD